VAMRVQQGVLDLLHTVHLQVYMCINAASHACLMLHFKCAMGNARLPFHAVWKPSTSLKLHPCLPVHSTDYLPSRVHADWQSCGRLSRVYQTSPC
jgi:hypothetical protein